MMGGEHVVSEGFWVLLHLLPVPWTHSVWRLLEAESSSLLPWVLLMMSWREAAASCL